MSILSPDYAEQLMRLALLQAEEAAKRDEVPIGAVIVYKGEIIAAAGNEVEKRKNATAHAEILAIERASEKLSNWRLDDAILCVTVEPCTMCFGAILNSRISTIIYGTSEPRTGALGSKYDLQIAAPNVRVIKDVLLNDCKKLLSDFFQKTREPC